MVKGEEVPWKCHTSAHPHASTLTEKQQTREVKGLSKAPVRHGSYHPRAPLGLPSQAGVVFSVDYCSHFRKDSRLYSYRRAGQSPKPYNLLPHPKGRPSVLVSSWMLRLLEMPPREEELGTW